ncbi:hypothetical protein [Aeromicrobium yanjiei]|uniref:Uncharacterized protein n=1 Tax=Aeromicrobium yanjiei TaxID=2662028 RepID=A0A5Q2MBN9_9ACTN|nr:hypothetical protein [Aeromicrobium yanjiei]QGG40504.1 hypothetical protein GEV26_03485 [Aeromicrobium yanjiei]
MTLRPLSDLSPADWLLDDPAPAALRVHLGPSGFAAYARVLHSPTGGGDRFEGHLDGALLAAVVDVLARHTRTPDDCCFALWEGYGDIHGGEAAGFLTAFSGPSRWPGRIFTKDKPKAPPPPAFPPDVMAGPLLTVNGEEHFLFAGPLADAGRWGAASYGGGVPRDINSPNLMWPADHAWFVTTTIEGTWTGVGGTESLIAELLHDPRLEVVRQRYDEGALR